MPKDIRVLIIEDDPFARDLMALLLTRDWRTRVIGEVSDAVELDEFLSSGDAKIDVVILDTEIPGAPELPFELAALTQAMPAPPGLLFTATQPQVRPADQLVMQGSGGYVLKSELLYALASAVSLVKAGHCVITPGIQNVLKHKSFPGETHVLDGRKRWAVFTPREQEIIRLAMIFNLAIRDMADELVLSPGWVSEIVSTIYMKLGLREILTGDVPLEEFFSDEIVLAHCREIARRGKSSEKLRKAPWMSTLAFHLLTLPEIKVL